MKSVHIEVKKAIMLILTITNVCLLDVLSKTRINTVSSLAWHHSITRIWFSSKILCISIKHRQRLIGMNCSSIYYIHNSFTRKDYNQFVKLNLDPKNLTNKIN